MERKIGEEFRSLATDPKQELSLSDMNFLRQMFPSKKSKKKEQAPKEESDTDSQDSDSDSDSDDEDEVQNSFKTQAPPAKNIMSELKATFIASILFILLSNQLVDNALKSMGMDGFKLLFIKLFLFAVLFFVVRYNFS